MQKIRYNHLTADRQRNSVSNKIQILRGLAIVAVVFIHNTPGGISQVVFHLRTLKQQKQKKKA